MTMAIDHPRSPSHLLLERSGDVKAGKSDMNCFSLAEGVEQFGIACEFDDLPAV